MSTALLESSKSPSILILLGGLAVPAVAVVLAGPLPCLRLAFLIANRLGSIGGGAESGLLKLEVDAREPLAVAATPGLTAAENGSTGWSFRLPDADGSSTTGEDATAAELHPDGKRSLLAMAVLPCPYGAPARKAPWPKLDSYVMERVESLPASEGARLGPSSSGPWP